MNAWRERALTARRIVTSGVYRPSQVRETVQAMTAHGRPKESRHHLRLAADWLAAAHRAVDGRGLSAGYSLATGWLPAYPETAGYTIETLYDLATALDDSSQRTLAAQLARWLLEIQQADGYFLDGTVDVARNPSVFNTGMILFGLVRAFDEEKDEVFREAAMHAARWLCSVQDAGGMWRQHTYRGRLHSYEARVAWGILEVWRRSGDESLRLCAQKQLRWVAGLQAANGFIASMDFAGEWPYTHTIAYTIRGLLEGGLLLEDAALVDAAERAAEALLHKYESTGRLAGQYDSQWSPASASVCVTGVAQMAICWARLAGHGSDLRYLNAALKARDFVKAAQISGGDPEHFRGAWPGSIPVWGSYKPFVLPEWGVKFACDALMRVDDAYARASTRVFESRP